MSTHGVIETPFVNDGYPLRPNDESVRKVDAGPAKQVERRDIDRRDDTSHKDSERLLATDEKSFKPREEQVKLDPLPAKSPSAGGFANTKLLCWDYNGTLEGSRGLRAGIAETTRELSGLGAYNVLTTTVDGESSGRQLRREGVEFDAYYGGSEVRRGFGNKSYAAVVTAAGMSREQARDRLLVIGDSPTDAPVDVPGVFIQDTSKTPAEAILLIATHLDRLGEGSFMRGLEKLQHDGQGRVRLGSLSFRIGEISNTSGRSTPTIAEITVDPDPQVHVKTLQAASGAAAGAQARLARNALGGIEGTQPQIEALKTLVAAAPKIAVELGERWVRELKQSNERETAKLKTLGPLPDDKGELIRLGHQLAAVIDGGSTVAVKVVKDQVVKLQRDEATLQERRLAEITNWALPRMTAEALEAVRQHGREPGFFSSFGKPTGWRLALKGAESVRSLQPDELRDLADALEYHRRDPDLRMLQPLTALLPALKQYQQAELSRLVAAYADKRALLSQLGEALAAQRSSGPDAETTMTNLLNQARKRV